MADRGVLFDVDGTLVDTNYLHVTAWWQAFRAHGHDVPMRRLHGLIGQGAERLVRSVLGHPDQDIADAHTDFYGPFLQRLQPLPGAGELLRAVKKSGLAVVLATSASEKEAGHLVAALGVDDVIDVVTNKDDADASKPDPDIVRTALEKAGLEPADAVFVGDTVWDVEAAGRAGLRCLCVRTGGIPDADLRDAGAVALYDDAGQLLGDQDRIPLLAGWSNGQ